MRNLEPFRWLSFQRHPLFSDYWFPLGDSRRKIEKKEVIGYYLFLVSGFPLSVSLVAGEDDPLHSNKILKARVQCHSWKLALVHGAPDIWSRMGTGNFS